MGALRGQDGRFLNTFEFGPLVSALLRSTLPVTAEDMTCIVSIVADRGKDARWCFTSPEIALRAVERFAEKSELSPELRRELESWKKAFGDEIKITVADRKIFTRIKTLLGEVGVPHILAGEAWSNAAIVGEAKSLSDVPALIFSEVMRDVDLFVGVCSIGNDPVWQDRGEGGQFGGYWHNYAFGDLSATASSSLAVRTAASAPLACACWLENAT